MMRVRVVWLDARGRELFVVDPCVLPFQGLLVFRATLVAQGVAVAVDVDGPADVAVFTCREQA
jgi:hypothetical protein